MALTPVAVLMFRFNNPDALLVLLHDAGGYAMIRAVETGGHAAGCCWPASLVGFAFLTKMLQALLVVPAFALAYLVAAPTDAGPRLLHLLGAGLAMVVVGRLVGGASSNWCPRRSRPYIGGSQTNSLWELICGYNGLGRLTGDETGSVRRRRHRRAGVRGRPASPGCSPPTFGGQIAWLLPAALVLLVAGLVAVRPRAAHRPAAGPR